MIDRLRRRESHFSSLCGESLIDVKLCPATRPYDRSSRRGSAALPANVDAFGGAEGAAQHLNEVRRAVLISD